MTTGRRATLALAAAAACLLGRAGFALDATVHAAAGTPTTATKEEGRAPPQVAVARAAAPPDIDGRLDDAVWADAAVIPDLTQVEPVEGVPPTQGTEVRLLYDADAIYFGIRAFDAEPDAILATEMERDSAFESDDRIVIVLDTFHDRRNGFRFAVNPLGARTDGLIEKSRTAGNDWDGIWYAAARIDDRGWVAEIAIPFKTVSFDETKTTWGFNIERTVRRNNEVSRWAAADQDRSTTDMADAGVLTNLVGLEQGIGLDVAPTGTVSHRRGRPDEGDETEADPALDVFYKILPSLTGALTFNTDFAETEVDERQIDLDRFELFFPEKRDFFLQDAGIFEFGGLERNGIPFFSRRIGLDENDEEVDILAGAKLTGRAGRYNIGILDVQTADKSLPPEDGMARQLESKNLFVGRFSANVLEQSTAGIIVTNGNPTGDESNSLIGADFNYRNTEILGDQRIDADLWVQHSISDENRGSARDDQLAYGARAEFGGDKIEGQVSFTEIGEDFNPALGFANRRGIRQYVAEGRYRHRFRPGGLIRIADAESKIDVITDDVDNVVQTVEAEVKPIKIENDAKDKAEFAVIVIHEELDEEFKIFRGDVDEEEIVIPPGSYTFDRYKVKVEASENRVVGGGIEAVYGNFFTGTRLELKPTLTLRPSPYVFLQVEYQHNDIDLPEGDFVTRLVRSRLVFQFSPDISWSTLVQFDNVSDSVGVNSRFRWIVEPGNDLFLVFNQSFEEDQVDGATEPSGTEIAAKLVWTFRF